MTGSAHVVRADARALPLSDESVDLVVTSPPYFALRDYGYDGQLGGEATPATFVDALVECTREMVRVLKPEGSLWVNLGDKYNSAASGQNGTLSTSLTGGRHDRMAGRGATVGSVQPKSLMGLPWRYAIRAVDELGLILRAEVVWNKPTGLPESVTDRVRRSHEQWFHLVRQPRYFAAVDEIREPHTAPTRVAGTTAFNGRNTNLPRASTGDYGGPSPFGKLPGSVWKIPSEPLRVPPELGVEHFAAFPVEFPRRIIAGWSPSFGTVLDPFGGTGTTALVARALGRVGISVDLSHDYGRLARWRVSDPDQLAHAMRVSKPPKQADGQLGLDVGEVTAA